jgi:hypothetical protein
MSLGCFNGDQIISKAHFYVLFKCLMPSQSPREHVTDSGSIALVPNGVLWRQYGGNGKEMLSILVAGDPMTDLLIPNIPTSK